MKRDLKDRIRSMLRGKDPIATVFYYDDKFHVIKDFKLIEITLPEAVPYLNAGSEFWHLLQDNRTVDPVTGQWVGVDPVHVKPEGLPRCRLVNVDITFPVDDLMGLMVAFSRQPVK